MYYKCHKVNFKCGGSYLDSPDWIINEKIECNPEKVSNIKPFINKYDLEGINYPLKIDAWKRFEKNNLTIALNILHIKEKEILQSLYFKTKLNL